MLGNHYKFFTECISEKSLKIGRYSAKIWTKLCGLLFWVTLYTFYLLTYLLTYYRLRCEHSARLGCL